MIYLSQLILNPASRMAQNECRNPYQMHRTLMQGFNCNREEANVLYRLDIHPYSDLMTLLVQSTIEPTWQPLTQVGQGQYLQSPPTYKVIELGLQNGRILTFRLRANPTIKKVRRDENGNRRNSNRVPLVQENKQLQWLEEKAKQSGFGLLDVHINPEGKQTDYHKKLTIYTILVNGRLQITDSEKFNTALRQGVGPAKAFGCGLLSLAPG
jgi:CRISPR system Cascade subunit CasE